MMVLEKLILPVSIQLPSDWKEQISAIAALNDLDAVGMSRLPENKITLSLQATASIGASAARFEAAVQEAVSQMKQFVDPPVPAYAGRLTAAAAKSAAGEDTDVTGRELLSWFGAARRGARVVERIREELGRHNLMTVPDFNTVWVDEPLKLRAKAPASIEPVPPAGEPPPPAAPPHDPVHRVGRLFAANQPVVSVPPGSTVDEAMTLMMLHDFSQLPVLQSPRECKGAVSWQSIGQARALGRSCAKVDDCMVGVDEVTWDTGLLESIPKVVSRGFVLVRSRDKKIQGIVTVSDLSLQFRLLSEPFLLLGQIENHIRVLVDRSFSLEEIRSAKNPEDTAREIDGVADLSFGEYVRLMEPTTAWPKLKVSFSRDPFLRQLREVVGIRNDVMHFDPEPLEDGQVALLRNFAAFLDRAVEL